MMLYRLFVFILVAATSAFGALADERLGAVNEMLYELEAVRGVTADQAKALMAIYNRSTRIGHGNPAITKHAIPREQCKYSAVGYPVQHFSDMKFSEVCGKPFMAPLYDPATQEPEDARACIDQFEYPNLPCAYPIVWATPHEASKICRVEGKRLCDAHEWEGACAGALESPGYNFLKANGATQRELVAAMRASHNLTNENRTRWSYGPEYKTGICATGSSKSAACDALGGYSACGSNTYPTGSFHSCVSALGVYDLHGNVAEIMNLPLSSDQMASAGSETLGVTELKGSWFIWDTFAAHPDWCRWRAPFWHGTRVIDPRGHANYHLGFRCCRSLN